MLIARFGAYRLALDTKTGQILAITYMGLPIEGFNRADFELNADSKHPLLSYSPAEHLLTIYFSNGDRLTYRSTNMELINVETSRNPSDVLCQACPWPAEAG